MKTFSLTWEEEQRLWMLKEMKKILAENIRLRVGLETALTLLTRATTGIGGLFSSDHNLYDEIMGQRPRLREILREER